MSTTTLAIQTKVNQWLHDSSTNAVSAADRLAAISVATEELITELNLGEEVRTYSLNYYDGIHYYDITSNVPDHFDPVDLQRAEGLHDTQVTRKDPRVLAADIDNGSTEFALAIDKRNGKNFLMVNHSPSNSAKSLETFDSLTANGTWAVDSTGSDATNLTLDEVEFKQGSGSFNFDVDVSQSANNKATVQLTDFVSTNLADYENLSAFVFWVYFPAITYITSVALRVGSSDSAYWTGTATTDYAGNAFVAGWNQVLINWSDMTTVGSPDASAIVYISFDINYSASQADDTDFRIDDLRVIDPEELTFKYKSLRLGTTSAGVSIYLFSYTDDVPFYSGQYDYLDNPISFRAAAILFDQIGDTTMADRYNGYYANSINKIKKKLPTFSLRETKSFRVKGISFRK